MIPPAIDEPSLGLVRARLIQDRLSAPDAASTLLPEVVATGKTGSGKSTLGNLLLGFTEVLRSTGRVDCTDAIHRVRFPRGLVYVDLPGVASSDRLENYNRVAFGLAQRPDWDQVSQVRVLDYTGREPGADRTYPVAELPAGTVAPGVILYLLAPQQPMVRDEQSYLRDLLRHCGGRCVVHVLNIHHHKSGGRVATEANMADARRGLADCHQAVGSRMEEHSVVEVDCLTGDGLADLLQAIRRALAEDQAKPLIEVITYQAEHALGRFRDEVTDAVQAYAMAWEGLQPGSDEEGTAMMNTSAQTLTQYAETLTGRDIRLGADDERRLRDLVSGVISAVRTEHREPVFKEKSKPVYRKVPITRVREETDYDKPIYGTQSVRERTQPVGWDGFVRGIDNLLSGNGYTDYRTAYRSVIVGYGTRRVTETVGYRDELDHTETYRVKKGTRVVSVSYQPFGVHGTTFALTAWYLAIRHAAGGGSQPDAGAIYRNILDAAVKDARNGQLLPADAVNFLARLVTK